MKAVAEKRHARRRRINRLHQTLLAKSLVIDTEYTRAERRALERIDD